jgi:2-dehydro-3-deoxygluconokinase
MDVFTFGETMVLMVPEKTGSLRFAESFHKTIGGAESNVAIALSRLGHSVEWFSKLGEDEFGIFVRNIIRGEGVDTAHVLFDKNNPTAVFFKERRQTGDPKVYYYRKNSAASTLCPEDLKDEYIKNAKILHITGITAAISESARETVHKAITIAKENGVKVVFDPNIRLKLWSESVARNELLKIARRCDVILPGIDEGKILTGESEPEKIAEKLLIGDCKTVVIKLGEYGAFYKTSESCEYIPGYKVEKIVDTVGAGDGFAAGFLSGILKEYNLFESVRLGNKIGSSALTTEGDMEGYPYQHELEQNNQILR